MLRWLLCFASLCWWRWSFLLPGRGRRNVQKIWWEVPINLQDCTFARASSHISKTILFQLSTRSLSAIDALPWQGASNMALLWQFVLSGYLCASAKCLRVDHRCQVFSEVNIETGFSSFSVLCHYMESSETFTPGQMQRCFFLSDRPHALHGSVHEALVISDHFDPDQKFYKTHCLANAPKAVSAGHYINLLWEAGTEQGNRQCCLDLLVGFVGFDVAIDRYIYI